MYEILGFFKFLGLDFQVLYKLAFIILRTNGFSWHGKNQKIVLDCQIQPYEATC